MAKLMLELTINCLNDSRNAFYFGHWLNVRQTGWLENCSHISGIHSLLFHNFAITLRVVRNVVQFIQSFDKIIKSDKFKMLSCFGNDNILFFSLLILDWIKKGTTNKSGFLQLGIWVSFNKLRSQSKTRLVNIFL